MTATGSRKSSAPQPATSGRFGERPRSNSAEGSRRGRRLVWVTWGQVTDWLPKIGRGPGLRPETPSDLLSNGRDGRI
jgi:hypothetical protein